VKLSIWERYVLDYETILTSVRKTNRLVVLEELGHLQVLLRRLYCSRACFDFHYPTYHHSRYSGTVFSCFVERLPNAGKKVKECKKISSNDLIFNMFYKNAH
jgi:hypothetical protein